jgi:multisubunit Na+/H+ antiporter MnhG subunit
MNQLLKNLGVLLILIAVFILSYYMVESPVENTLLVVAGLLILTGLSAHIILNRSLE